MEQSHAFRLFTMVRSLRARGKEMRERVEGVGVRAQKSKGELT